jgi:hypothetical protein
MTGSAFADYVTNALSFNFNVDEFAKTEVPVEVLCLLLKSMTPSDMIGSLSIVS